MVKILSNSQNFLFFFHFLNFFAKLKKFSTEKIIKIIFKKKKNKGKKQSKSPNAMYFDPILGALINIIIIIKKLKS
jgi:hypothetical protein